jgi:endoglucanase
METKRFGSKTGGFLFFFRPHIPNSLPMIRLPILAIAPALFLQTLRFTACGADADSPIPLIANGSFETSDPTNQWPDKWERLKKGVSWEQENGNHFLRLTATAPGETILLYHPVILPEGVRALELTWRQRITNLKPGKQAWFDARIMLEFKDAAGKRLSPSPAAPYARENTRGWEERSARFLVPEGARTLEFMPTLFQVETGTFDLDDVALRGTDPVLLKETAKAADQEQKNAIVAPEPPLPARWPKELHVKGNQVLNKEGKPVWLQGVNVVSLEFLLTGDHVMKSAQVAVDDWKANIIRLPVKDDYWFGKAAGQNDGGAAYRGLVDNVITMVANHGAYVLLDLHRFRAPNHDHLEFWKNAAAKYKDHPAVLFDLFNEPHGISWEVWRNGGFVPDKEAPADEDAFLTEAEKATAAKGFHSVGMQGLVNAVREAGAHNVVVAGGLDWAYDLSGIAHGFELSDTDGPGIIYSTHIYPWKHDWKDKVLVVAEQHPIFVGEVGADIHKMSFIPADQQEDPYTWVPDMIGFIQKYKLHWTAFSFHPKATPVLITGWDYTPTPFWGAFVESALAGKQFPLGKMR